MPFLHVGSARRADGAAPWDPQVRLALSASFCEGLVNLGPEGYAAASTITGAIDTTLAIPL